TANWPCPTGDAPAAGKSRSGSAWLGRSQKDGLPTYRGDISLPVQGHQLAHRGGAAWSLPLSNRERNAPVLTWTRTISCSSAPQPRVRPESGGTTTTT